MQYPIKRDAKSQFLHTYTLLFGLICLCSAQFAWSSQPDWSEYNRVLRTYVTAAPENNSRVNLVRYSRLARNHALRPVVEMIENYPLENLQTHEEKLSFYINAYNIFTINLALENWPLKSIKSVGNILHPVWEKRAGLLGGKPVSLDYILHRILRPMNEPRIHFAINCASRGCPQIRREAYEAERLSEQLDDQVQSFLKIRNGFRLLPKKESIRVSKHFRWYREDFEQAGGIAAFLRNYTNIPEGYTIKPNITYDWDLNGK